MIPSSNGLKSSKNINNILIKYKKIINYDLHITNPIIDSSNVSINNWNKWLNIIKKNINNYYGILILHGTDTLSYTSSILACCLENLNKPIIITGSMYTAYDKNTDVFDNIKASLYLFYTKYNKVGIVFNNKLLNPFNCSKYSSYKKDAFKTPYCKYLAKFNLKNNNWNFQINTDKLQNFKKQNTLINFLLPNIKISNFFITPNLINNYLDSIIDNYDYDAIILQSFGNGNIPNDKKLITSLTNFIKKNKTILNISQNFQGDAKFIYETNYRLSEIGVINCGKITIETAYAKLAYCISCNFNKHNLITYVLKQNEEYIFNN